MRWWFGRRRLRVAAPDYQSLYAAEAEMARRLRQTVIELADENRRLRRNLEMFLRDFPAARE